MNKFFRTIILLIFFTGVFLMPPPAGADISGINIFTDRVEVVGNVHRMYYYIQITFSEGSKEWHYFGTTSAEKPPATADPVFEHTYIQMPNELDNLGNEYVEDELSNLAILAGTNRENITGGLNIFTDSFEIQGVTYIFNFRIENEGEWYYFGSAIADFPCPAATCIEVSDIRFPRDFQELGTGDEIDDLLYNLALEIGLKREGLQ